MSKKIKRLLSCFLAALVVIPALSVTASAKGTAQPEPAGTSVPAVTPGEKLVEESDIVTRDLRYDKATNKQFATIQDREGNFFYLVIDYDSPVDEDEEQFKTYFLNPVDAADLAALVKENQSEPPVCTCAEKCGPGHIDMSCPVCATNMAECMGKEPAPPEVKPEPSAPDATKPEEEIRKGANPAMLLGVLGLAAVGVTGAFLKLKKGKNQTPVRNPEDYDNAIWETEGEEESEDEEK